MQMNCLLVCISLCFQGEGIPFSDQMYVWIPYLLYAHYDVSVAAILDVLFERKGLHLDIGPREFINIIRLLVWMRGTEWEMLMGALQVAQCSTLTHAMSSVQRVGNRIQPKSQCIHAKRMARDI